MKHKIAAACAAAGMATFGSIALAAPAQAASYIDFCFVYENGKPWAGKPTSVHALTNGGWVEIGAIVANDKGCAAYKVWGEPVDLPIHGYAYQAIPGPFGKPAYYYEGITNNAPVGAGGANLGTYIVYCTPGDLLCP
jgi:hypothetical protein